MSKKEKTAQGLVELAEFRDRELQVLEIVERFDLLGKPSDEFKARFVAYIETVLEKGSIQAEMDEELDRILVESREQCKELGLLTFLERNALENGGS